MSDVARVERPDRVNNVGVPKFTTARELTAKPELTTAPEPIIPVVSIHKAVSPSKSV
jgi:hypothetical protein